MVGVLVDSPAVGLRTRLGGGGGYAQGWPPPGSGVDCFAGLVHAVVRKLAADVARHSARSVPAAGLKWGDEDSWGRGTAVAEGLRTLVIVPTNLTHPALDRGHEVRVPEGLGSSKQLPQLGDVGQGLEILGHTGSLKRNRENLPQDATIRNHRAVPGPLLRGAAHVTRKRDDTLPR